MVIRTAFPNMPLAFLDDPEGKRYQETYFMDFDHPVFNMVSYHVLHSHARLTAFGDSCRTITSIKVVRMVECMFRARDEGFRFNKLTITYRWLLGRSDGVLNPSGVRFGSAELYYILEKEFKHDVVDSLAVGQKLQNGDERVVLFLVTPEDKPLGADLVKRIQDAIAQRLSRRHVPAVMEKCPGVPVTLSGKKLESSVKKLV